MVSVPVLPAALATLALPALSIAPFSRRAFPDPELPTTKDVPTLTCEPEPAVRDPVFVLPLATVRPPETATKRPAPATTRVALSVTALLVHVAPALLLNVVPELSTTVPV